MFQIKIRWSNKNNFARLEAILKTIPKEEPVLDLTGETIFYPDGYYFCCLPYGQYEEMLLFNYPDIGKAMERKQTKYVYTGGQNRLTALPFRHARYIEENFQYFWSDKTLWIKKPK